MESIAHDPREISGDEDEGSPSRDGVNRETGKIEGSADALR